MSPAESAAIERLRQEIEEFRGEVSASRTEISELRGEVAPAVALAAKFTLAGSILIGTAHVAKWGIGVGAGIATVGLFLVAIGVVHP